MWSSEFLRMISLFCERCLRLTGGGRERGVSRVELSEMRTARGEGLTGLVRLEHERSRLVALALLHARQPPSRRHARRARRGRADEDEDERARGDSRRGRRGERQQPPAPLARLAREGLRYAHHDPRVRTPPSSSNQRAPLTPRRSAGAAARSPPTTRTTSPSSSSGSRSTSARLPRLTRRWSDACVPPSPLAPNSRSSWSPTLTPLPSPPRNSTPSTRTKPG